MKLLSYIICEDPKENKNKFIKLVLIKTLSGQPALKRIWGRTGTRGSELIIPYPTASEAQEAAISYVLRKTSSRGYREYVSEMGSYQLSLF